MGCFSNYRNSSIEEGRRLLYVGVTRARDILVEVGQHGKSCEFLKDVLGGITSGTEWTAKTDKNWVSGSYHEIWGSGTPKFYYREITAEAPPEMQFAETYNYLPQAGASNIAEAKRVSPSSLSDEALVKATSAVCLIDDGKPFSQIINKAVSAKDDEIGTCIHNIFAAYDPNAIRSDMVHLAKSCIARHGLSKVLINPDDVISSIESLFDILEHAYGKAVRIEHELPFRELRGGQMTVGSIDMIWFTSAKDCVLVDFKNLPNAGRNVLDPADLRFLGHYAPQQKAYMDALARDGFNVKDCIIYLAMQGKAVRLRF